MTRAQFVKKLRARAKIHENRRDAARFDSLSSDFEFHDLKRRMYEQFADELEATQLAPKRGRVKDAELVALSWSIVNNPDGSTEQRSALRRLRNLFRV